MPKSATEWEKLRLEMTKSLLHLLAAAVLGLAFFPMVMFLVGVWKGMGAHPLWMRALIFSFSIGFGYFIFGFTLIVVCALTKTLFRFKIAPGLHSFHSKETLSWMGYNSMVLVANSAFLDVLRLSPFQTMFYRWMGAKVGERSNINTGGLADLSLLEIGDDVTIGGGVALICHAAERGYLRLEKTKLGNKVSVGIGSVIFPGCELGDGAVIAPMSLLPRGTKVPPKGYWGGNPARDLRAERRSPAEDVS
jgi:non-ribosomal peptide synthetase-like protein